MTQTKQKVLDTRVVIVSTEGQPGNAKHEARAVRAAEAVLRRHKVSAVEAYKAFMAALDERIEFNDAAPRLARIWFEATCAADAAYSKDWCEDDHETFVVIEPAESI